MDEVRRQLLRAWVTKAAGDLRAARILGSTEDALLDPAIYHCQQAAEKVVKAFLVSKEVTPEKTHDIVRVVLAAAAFEPRFNELRVMAATLTPYAWAFRYPDDLADTYPAREEFEQALGSAQTIYDFVLSLLPAEARP